MYNFSSLDDVQEILGTTTLLKPSIQSLYIIYYCSHSFTEFSVADDINKTTDHYTISIKLRLIKAANSASWQQTKKDRLTGQFYQRKLSLKIQLHGLYNNKMPNSIMLFFLSVQLEQRTQAFNIDSLHITVKNT